MFVLHPEAAGTVVALLGKAVARGPDGSLRMLDIGDQVGADEVILTAQNGYVQLASAPAVMPRSSHALSTASPKVVVLAAGAADPSPVVAESSGSGLQAALRLEGAAGTDPVNTGVLATGGVPTDGPSRAIAARSGAVDRLAPLADAGGRHVVAEDTPLGLSIGGRDPDGSISQVFIVKVPTGGLLYRPDGDPIADRTALTPAEAARLVFIPAPHFHGDPGPLQYMVEDATGKLSAVATLTISVTPVNDAPMPGLLPIGPDLTPYPDPDPHHLAGTPDYRWRTDADTPVFGQIGATDVDGDPLRFAAGTAPAHGQVLVAADGSFVYTPAAGWLGADRFVVTVDDGHGGVATSTVYIDVTVPGSAASATPAGMATDAAAAAVPAPEAAVLALPLENPLGFDEIFGRAHVERAATHQVQPGSDVDADVLQLSALLVGHLPMAGAPGMPSPETRLDLGLDWGLRANGLDWLKNPPGQGLT